MQQASLVICVDQLKDIFRAYEEGPMSAMRDMFRRAVVTLRTLSDHLPGNLASYISAYSRITRRHSAMIAIENIEHTRNSFVTVAQPSATVIRMQVKQVLRMLQDDGWTEVARRGSHRQFKHKHKPNRVTVAGKLSDDLAPGTLNSILEQAGLKSE